MKEPVGQEPKKNRLVYLIGTYPELTNTFIDREIATLRRFGDFQIQIVSLRYPRTLASCSPEQKALCTETLYLIPARWSEFNFLAFFLANFYFIFSQPLVYFGTWVELLVHSSAGLKPRMMAFLYFWQGVLAAYLLRHTPFDHIHVHFMDRAVLVALVVGRFLKKTYSFTAHAADIYTRAGLVHEKIENAAFVITVSRYNLQYLRGECRETEPGKIHILHPWVDLSQFTPGADRPVHTRLRILSVGRLVEKKGHRDLIEAFSLLREKGVEAECRIVGDGPLHAELAERITGLALQDQVHLLGGMPQDRVLDLLREWADVFILPCVIAKNGDRDGIPVSIAEAMAMELPVISTDIVGISELVQPGTGILVSPHDPAGLAHAIANLASHDPLEAAQMGQKGREVVDREFNLLKGTQELAGFFRQVIAQSKANDEEMIKNVTP